MCVGIFPKHSLSVFIFDFGGSKAELLCLLTPNKLHIFNPAFFCHFVTFSNFLHNRVDILHFSFYFLLVRLRLGEILSLIKSRLFFPRKKKVIQRRDDFGEPRENFNRDWADYKNGFGDPAKEFWMGNENIYMLTNNEDYALRIELEDFEGNKR